MQSFKECQQGQYQCKGGQCISPQFVCDGKKDCPLADDEEDCGECTADGVFKGCVAGGVVACWLIGGPLSIPPL